MIHTLTNFVDYGTIVRAKTEVDSLELQRYDNPFERKSCLENKMNLPPCLTAIFNELKHPDTARWVSRILDVPISHADFLHYGGLFKYERGDYLRPHVDAGVHPTFQLHKIATALVYLTPATLETWRGDTAANDYPEIWLPTEHHFNANDCVLFANTDSAWHSVPLVQGTQPRIVLTVSYLAPPGFTSTRFRNKRTRAYFAHVVGEHETPELKALRELRSSEEHHSEVYRT